MTIIKCLACIVYLTICWVLPDILGSARPSDCPARYLLANLCYAYGVVGLILLVQVITWIKFLCAKRHLAGIELITQLQRNYIKTMVITLILSLLGNGVWFWAVQVTWSRFSIDGCLGDTWDILDFFNFVVILLYTLGYGAMLAMCVACCPFMYTTVSQFFKNLYWGAASENTNDDVLTQ